MENRGKKVFHIVITGVLAALCCIGLLFVSLLVPQEKVRKNAQASAEFFGDTQLFENLQNNRPATRRDNYADCISTSVAWHFGNRSAIEGTNRNSALVRALEARYTQVIPENVNDGLLRAVNEDAQGNVTYSRYWHGGAAVIRLLLPFMNIRSMRILFLVTGILLNLGFIVYLILRKEYAVGIAYTLGILSGHLFFSYLCFEYAFVCLMVPVFSFLVYRLTEKERKTGRRGSFGALFLAAGIITCFFDFLTAETLTFTVPAFVMLACMTKKQTVVVRSATDQNSLHSSLWKRLLSSGFLWLAGYAGMFGIKWIWSSVLLGGNEWKTTASYVAERAVGDVHLTQNMTSPTVSLAVRIREIFIRNFSCLFNLPESMPGTAKALLILGTAAGIALLWFFLRKDGRSKEKRKKDKSFFPLFLILMLVPVLRFLVLSNHAYMHYFFTYRALMIVVMVLSLQFLRTTLLDRLTESR